MGSPDITSISAGTPAGSQVSGVGVRQMAFHGRGVHVRITFCGRPIRLLAPLRRKSVEMLMGEHLLGTRIEATGDLYAAGVGGGRRQRPDEEDSAKQEGLSLTVGMSYGPSRGLIEARSRGSYEGLSGDVALETANCLAFEQALGMASLHVGTVVSAVAQPRDRDHVEGAVEEEVAGQHGRCPSLQEFPPV